jgi:hypothetical protein
MPVTTYLLVHGGAHGGWCYQTVATRLRAAGHDVYAPTLTGLGERSHLRHAGIDLDLHVTDILNVLFYEDLRDVVLVPDPDNPHTFGVEDPAVVAWMAPRLAPHPWRCFTQPVRIAHPELVAAIPQSHIVASPTLPDEHPERVAAARAAGRVWLVETGHDLMLSEPDTAADLLLRLG